MTKHNSETRMTPQEFYEKNATNVCHVPRVGHPEDPSGWAGVRRASEARFIAPDCQVMTMADAFDFAEKYARSGKPAVASSPDRAEELAREITSRLVADWGYQAPGAANWADGVAPEDKWLAALLRSRMAERWIPVSERLPKFAELPCLYIDYAGKHQIGRPISYDRCWMPLTALPSAPDTEEKA